MIFKVNSTITVYMKQDLAIRLHRETYIDCHVELEARERTISFLMFEDCEINKYAENYYVDIDCAVSLDNGLGYKTSTLEMKPPAKNFGIDFNKYKDLFLTYKCAKIAGENAAKWSESYFYNNIPSSC